MIPGPISNDLFFDFCFGAPKAKNQAAATSQASQSSRRFKSKKAIPIPPASKPQGNIAPRSAPFGVEANSYAPQSASALEEQTRSIVGDQAVTEPIKLLIVNGGHQEPPSHSTSNQGEASSKVENPKSSLQGPHLSTNTLPTDAKGRPFWPADYVHYAVVALAGERGVICTGTLVRRRAVLTAGHCRSARWVLVGVREVKLARRIEIGRFVLPPNELVDAAVAILSADVPAEPYPMRGASDSEPPDTSVRLVGFGVSNFVRGTGAEARRWADVRVAGWGCDASTEQTSGCVSLLEMAIRAQDGVDTCAGDSGGPVLEIFDGKPRLVALTSRGVRNGSAACGSGGVYVRVDRLRAWLDQRPAKHLHCHSGLTRYFHLSLPLPPRLDRRTRRAVSQRQWVQLASPSGLRLMSQFNPDH